MRLSSQTVQHLNGQSVLVKSAQTREDPPVALRGTIDASEAPVGEAEIKIVLEYPDMNNAAAHRGVIHLDDMGVERLLAGEHDGVYEITINEPLDPGPEPRMGPQAVS